MTKSKILITGGAGYIGSHAARNLIELGFDVVILDDLSIGSKKVVPPNATFIEGTILDPSDLDRVFSQHNVDAVMHFAASSDVGESVEQPEKYFRNNVDGTATLLAAMARAHVQRIIFSSTAAVYGIPTSLPVTESSTTQPINPYGVSKLKAEMLIREHADTHPGFKFVILRYFNVAGCRADLLAGPNGKAKQLIRVACKVAIGKDEVLQIFGTDYETPDGTCVRDFIHVQDLVSAHTLALKYMSSGDSETFNVGYGHGFSVLQVVDTIEKLTGAKLRIAHSPRRIGDPPNVYADPQKIRRLLGWAAENDNILEIVKSSLEWERTL